VLCEQIGILTRLFRFPKEVHECFCVEQASFRIIASNVLRARKNNKFSVKMRSQSRFCAGELQHTRSKMNFSVNEASLHLLLPGASCNLMQIMHKQGQMNIKS
jgi:hypothetical protein